MKKKSSFFLKSHFEKMLKAFWKKLENPPKRKPRKRVNKTTDDWRTNIMWLRNGLYQINMPVPLASEKIHLVSRTEGIAYELKIESLHEHPTLELANSLFKVDFLNRHSKFKIKMLAFITEESNIPLLEMCGMAQTMFKKAAEADLRIEIIGV
ncbi:MAG TPA: hypothetical protein VK810_04905 [Dongiaceae bacterium]|jgi:hypothetical protein|nr:hypothetical protein [Dongiaceae bacterium]